MFKIAILLKFLLKTENYNLQNANNGKYHTLLMRLFH